MTDRFNDEFVPFTEFGALEVPKRYEEPAVVAADVPAEVPTEVPVSVEATESLDETFDVAAGELATALHPIGDAEAALEPDVDTESRAQLARRIVWAPRTRAAVVSLALIAMMFLFVFPTRSYLAQKRQVGEAAHAVEVLEAQNEVLARQASRLRTRGAIERLAREQFNMVRPGEQAYNVVERRGSDDDTTTTTAP